MRRVSGAAVNVIEDEARPVIWFKQWTLILRRFARQSSA
jgi:hypothetical protein